MRNSEPDADSYAYSIGYTYPNCNPYSYSERDSNAFSYSKCHTYS